MRPWLFVVLVAGGCGRIGFSELAPVGDATGGEQASDLDLVVHVTFDDDATAIGDEAGSLGAATCANGRCPSLVPGRIGNAARFDGTDDFLQFASVQELDFGTTQQAFSVAIWYRALDLTPPTQRVLMAQSTDGGLVSYQLSFEPWQAGAPLDLVWKVCATDCQSGVFAVASDLAAIDRWTLIVGTWDGIDTRLYVDAQLVATVPKLTVVYDGFPLMIGADLETGLSIEDTFDGDLDDLRIYRRALSEVEQQQLLATP